LNGIGGGSSDGTRTDSIPCRRNVSIARSIWRS
jgi:hypothetical protein